MSRARSFAKKAVRSPFEVYGPKFLQGYCRAFCTDPEQKAELLAFGFPEREIHMLGHGSAESLQTAVDTFRGRPGTIAIASDLRVIGASRPMLYSSLHRLDSLKIQVVDIRHLDDTRAQREERALRAIAHARFTDNPRKARSCGSKGGRARGVSEWNKRDEIAPRWLLCNMVAALGAKKTAELVENKISESSFRRNYAT